MVTILLQPCSYVMDFIVCCPDSMYVSIGTVQPSLLPSSSFSSLRIYHLKCLSSEASSLLLSKVSQLRFPVPFYTCDILYTSILSLRVVTVS